MTRSNREGTHIELPVEIREAMKDEDDPMWRIVADAVQIYLGLEQDNLAALNRRVELTNQQISNIEDELEELEAERDELASRRDQLNMQIDQLHEERQDYDEILEDVINELVASESLGIDSQFTALRAAAEVQNDGVATEDAIESVREDVRSLVHERDVDVADRQLSPSQTVSEREYLSEPDTPTLQFLNEENHE